MASNGQPNLPDDDDDDDDFQPDNIRYRLVDR